MSSSTIDDADTQYIQYVGAGWGQQDPTNPTWNVNFYKSTCRFTGGDGDSVHLAFKGTGVEFFAATRNNHGLHSVYLDDDPNRTIINTYSAGDAFNVSIYAAKDLKDGVHSVKIVNEPKMTNIAGRVGLGLDWIVIQGTPIEWKSAAVAMISAQPSSSSAIASFSSDTLPSSTSTSAVGAVGIAASPSSFSSSSGLPASSRLLTPTTSVRPDIGPADPVNDPEMVYTAFSAASRSTVMAFGAQSEPPRLSPLSSSSQVQPVTAPFTLLPLACCCLIAIASITRIFPWH